MRRFRMRRPKPSFAFIIFTLVMTVLCFVTFGHCLALGRMEPSRLFIRSPLALFVIAPATFFAWLVLFLHLKDTMGGCPERWHARLHQWSNRLRHLLP